MYRFAISCEKQSAASSLRCPILTPPEHVTFEELDGWIEMRWRNIRGLSFASRRRRRVWAFWIERKR